MATRRVLCKFFVHGACLKGDHCEFSHDWRDQPNMVCSFYQKGVCSYGSRCRYDHVKIKHPTKSVPTSSSRPSVAACTSHASYPSDVQLNGNPKSNFSTNHQLSAQNQSSVPLDKSAWTQNVDLATPPDDELCPSASLNPSDRPICSFAAAGSCPRGERCPHLHGDLCSICGKHCLHPYRSDEREEHIKLCQKNNKYLDALRLSQEIECSVCLERVLSKPTAAERKFGLLSECDHPFCVSCIRNWRSSSATGVDVNAALRACPICRKLSYFVIPSIIWYSTKEEKQEIIENYKSKLKSIDCKYFDFGNGSCPFGTSCFYKHAYRDGRLEEVVLRHLSSEDGGAVIARDIRLSEFLSSMRI